MANLNLTLPTEIWLIIFSYIRDPEVFIKLSTYNTQLAEVITHYDATLFALRVHGALIGNDQRVDSNSSLCFAKLGKWFSKWFNKWYMPKLVIKSCATVVSKGSTGFKADSSFIRPHYVGTFPYGFYNIALKISRAYEEYRLSQGRNKQVELRYPNARLTCSRELLFVNKHGKVKCI